MIIISILLLISKTLSYPTNYSYNLIEAASSGNLTLVKFLVEERGLVPKITTLRTAASFGNLDVVR
jgi:hypothetical protein